LQRFLVKLCFYKTCFHSFQHSHLHTSSIFVAIHKCLTCTSADSTFRQYFMYNINHLQLETLLFTIFLKMILNVMHFTTCEYISVSKLSLFKTGKSLKASKRCSSTLYFISYQQSRPSHSVVNNGRYDLFLSSSERDFLLMLSVPKFHPLLL
jgi:hypothetical protein